MLKTGVFAAALAIASVPASAERPAATERVTYRDLDLTTVAGRQALEARIRQGAEVACRRELRGAAWTPLELHICLNRTAADSRASAERATDVAVRTGPMPQVSATR